MGDLIMAVHYPLKKNILWVDDFDIKSSSMHKSSKTRSKLSKEQLIKNKISVFDEKYRDSIEVK